MRNTIDTMKFAQGERPFVTLAACYHASWLKLESQALRWLSRHSVTALRLSIGITFLWFGALKFIPGLSPAEELALRTIDTLSLGLMPALLSRVLLAGLECLIGLGFLLGRSLRLTLWLFGFQMIGTLTPLFLFPGETFGLSIVVPTLEGQYIIKNLVLVSAGMVIAATVRRGSLDVRTGGM